MATSTFSQPTVPPDASLTPNSASMGGMAMASLIANAPQAGMATSMADIKNMCSVPGMQDMCAYHTDTMVGVCAALLVLATTAVMLRLIAMRLSTWTFWWDDVAILLSLVLSYACSALTFIDADNGVGRHFETVRKANVDMLFKTTIAYQILYCVCVSLIKISILLFYYRLFGVRKQFKITVFVVLGLVCAWCIAIVLLDVFQCVPVKAAWIRPYPHSKCIDNNATMLGTAITNVVLDLTILVLPLTPIWNLALTFRQKISLTAIFLLGAFICAAAIVRVWAISNIDQRDVTWSYARPLTWSAVEISIAITCACLPTLQPVLRATFALCVVHTQLLHSGRRTRRKNQNTTLDSATALSRYDKTQIITSPSRGMLNRDFYRQENAAGNGKTSIVTSVWASREDLTINAEDGALGRSSSEDKTWLNGIHVMQEIEVDSERGGEHSV
ncbi:MAG: hypothetical protein Q9217_005706 [Psora testacea]